MILNLRTKQEVHHIAVFHHVFLSLSAHLAGVFGALLAFEGDEVFKGDGLGADWPDGCGEVGLEVRIKRTSTLNQGGYSFYLPQLTKKSRCN